jgi:hypothetical protein
LASAQYGQGLCEQHDATSHPMIADLRGFRDQWRAKRKIFPSAVITGPLHYALICLEFQHLRRFRKNEQERNN